MKLHIANIVLVCCYLLILIYGNMSDYAKLVVEYITVVSVIYVNYTLCDG
jgi:hypothetical protein